MEESATRGREDTSSVLTPSLVAPHAVEQTKSGLDGDGGRGFGLGVGLTLTPEFAQKVRSNRMPSGTYRFSSRGTTDVRLLARARVKSLES